MITRRDMEVVAWLDAVGYARTGHVARVHFGHLAQAGHVARRRLRRLLEAGLVRRFSDARLGEYVWHTRTREKGQKYQHGLMVAAVEAALASHPDVAGYEYHPAYRRDTGSGYTFEADAFLVARGRTRTVLAFVECDNAENLQAWETWRKYEDYFLAGAWRWSEPWWDRYHTFPRVVFVGPGPRLAVMRSRMAGRTQGRLRYEWLDTLALERGDLGAMGFPLAARGVDADA